MAHQLVPPGSVLVGIDGSEHSDHALLWAAERAVLEHRTLVLVHAYGMLTPNEKVWLGGAGISPELQLAEMRAAGQVLLREAAEGASGKFPGLSVVQALRDGDARDALFALDDTASMLVLGSRGRGIVGRIVLGSVSVAMARHATCPVAVVRPQPTDVERRGVLVGTDGSAHSLGTVAGAFREASIRSAPLTVVHCVWDDAPMRESWRRLEPGSPQHAATGLLVAELIAGFREQYPDVDVEPVLARGLVDQCLVELARTHELLVVGRHGTSILDVTSLGSLATAMVERAETVVLVLP